MGANAWYSQHGFKLIQAENISKRAEERQKRERESDGKEKHEKKDLFSHKILAYWHCHRLIWTAYNELTENTVFQYNNISSVLLAK